MKIGKRRLHEGNLDGAERSFWRALEIATDYDNPYRKDIGIVEHQLACISARRGDTDRARWRFQKAAHRIENNPMGRAICLRDHANFELLEGNNSHARSLLGRSLVELGNAKASVAKNRKKRLEVEVSVTKAFVARIDLSDDRRTEKATRQLTETAQLLRQYGKKPAYELANLGWLVEALPLEERQPYIERARELSAELGNLYKWGEYTALRYGYTARAGYRLAAATTSFGITILKGVGRIVTSI